MDVWNSKPNKQHKFVSTLWQRLDLRISNKHVAFPKPIYLYKTTLQIQWAKKNSSNVKWRFQTACCFLLSVNYSRLYNNNNNNTPLKHESLPTSLAIDICINGINKSLLFKIADRYQLKLQKIETMTLFGSSKN